MTNSELLDALIAAVETIECMKSCSSPALDEVEATIEEGRTLIAKYQGEIMTNHQFAIWLATWQCTQRQVAYELGITEQTLSAYKRNENYPKWFVLALRGLETKGV